MGGWLTGMNPVSSPRSRHALASREGCECLSPATSGVGRRGQGRGRRPHQGSGVGGQWTRTRSSRREKQTRGHLAHRRRGRRDTRRPAVRCKSRAAVSGPPKPRGAGGVGASMPSPTRWHAWPGRPLWPALQGTAPRPLSSYRAQMLSLSPLLGASLQTSFLGRTWGKGMPGPLWGLRASTTRPP